MNPHDDPKDARLLNLLRAKRELVARLRPDLARLEILANEIEHELARSSQRKPQPKFCFIEIRSNPIPAHNADLTEPRASGL